MLSSAFRRVVLQVLVSLSCAGSGLASPQPEGEDYVYVYEPAVRRVLGYRILAESGSLELVTDIAGPARSAGLAADPLGRFLYVGDSSTGSGASGKQILSLRIDSASGRLSSTGPSDWSSASALPTRLLATEQYLYMAAGSTFTGTHGGLYRFALDPTSGGLHRVAFPTRSTEPTFVAADAQERFVYSAGRLSGSGGDELSYVLETHVLDPDGTLRETSSETGRASTWAGARGGSWLFVARDDELVTLALDPNTGRTRQVSALSYRSEPLTYARLVTDPNGRLLALLVGQAVQIYTVDGQGRLRASDRLELTSTATASVAFDPFARLLLLSQAGEGLRVFRIESGRLEEGPRAAGGGPVTVAHVPAPKSVSR